MTKDQPSAVVFKKTLTDPSKIHAIGLHHKFEIGDGIEKLYRWYLKN